jgi:glycosyltransferase involved in cell wall biosynthesis
LILLRVGFNAYLLRDANLRGWNRYTVNLLAALPAYGVRPILYSREPIHRDHLARLPADSYEVRVAPPMRYGVWENLWLPRQLRIDRIDVFHSPFNYGLPWSTPCPRVLTLHDAIDQIYYLRQARWWQRWRPSAIRMRLSNWAARLRAHQIITVSYHAQKDIMTYLRVPACKVSVIYEAADPLFHRPVAAERVEGVRQKWDLSRPYFLYVGGWEKRKNVPFLLRAFAGLKVDTIDLVLAGGQEQQRPILTKLAEELGCVRRVRLLGYVPEADLPALYAGALAFVYPSEYEGFGLQVCEAMAVGCPVLVARATSLPEIAGNGGETFALDDPGELAGLLRRVADDAAFRADLSRRAKVRASDFSWDRAAAETVRVYQQLQRGVRT